MWIAGVIAVMLSALTAYKYRLRKPDQLVLGEADGTIRLRRRVFYPRHFSLALPGTIQAAMKKKDRHASALNGVPT